MHDVAPATWPACRQLLDALDTVAPIPVTLLIVPDYHRRGALHKDAAFCRAIEQRLARGDELALHGYHHLDEGPPASGVWQRLRRGVYTAYEGEFAALSVSEARARLEQGLELMHRLRWPVAGFVPPAWLMSTGAWEAVQDMPFAYTSNQCAWFRLPTRERISSYCLVHSVRSALRRRVSQYGNVQICNSMQSNQLLRLGLHPVDAYYPDVVHNWQTLLQLALQTRTAMTKNAFLQTLN
jgi:predicted deacetylase